MGTVDLEDRGRTWRRGNEGLNPRYLPAEALKDQNAPKQPDRMFMQFHGGVYRSDDAGEGWTDIGGGGLPPDFGFLLTVDPADPVRRHGSGYPRRPGARL